MNINRLKDKKAISELLALFPVVAILGPRQCGKTTLSQTFKAQAHFDFENPQDWETFSQPLLAVERLKGLVVIDEVQRMPELFPVLRHIVDTRKDLRFLILGSASRALIRQSSESLAGRIAYHELSGFSMSDLGAEQWQKLWMRGGFPLVPYKPTTAIKNKVFQHEEHEEHEVCSILHLFVSFVNFVVRILGLRASPALAIWRNRRRPVNSGGNPIFRPSSSAISRNWGFPFRHLHSGVSG